ncbi:MAG: macro domain-containing protein, partial [Clostridia bacterium]|nr:macro domain-containing protein [Clostridia bacterium]
NYKDKDATVKIADTLDPNVELVEDGTTPEFIKSGRTLTWEIPTAVGETAKVTLVVKVLDGAVEMHKIDNQAKASVGINNVYDAEQWTNEEENPLTEPPVKKETQTAGEEAVLSETVEGGASEDGKDLEIYGVVKPGDLVTYEISQENYKDKDATVKIVDTLDPNVELVTDGTTEGYTQSGRTLTWELPTAVGETAKVTLVVRVLESALEVYKIGNQAKASVGIDNVYDTEQWTDEEENPLTEPPVKKETLTAGEEAVLSECYRDALALAVSLRQKAVSIPLLGTGESGFPEDRALKIACKAVSEALSTAPSDLDVFLCLEGRGSIPPAWAEELRERFGAPEEKPEENVCDQEISLECLKAERKIEPILPDRVENLARFDQSFSGAYASRPAVSGPPRRSSGFRRDESEITDWLNRREDSFSVMLTRLIDEKKMTDVECYKKANVSRKTFSKIRNEKGYRPSKNTVLSFAIALELDMEETESLLRTVGFALSRSETADRIVEFFIRNRNFDIYEINAALYSYGEECLGC